MKNLPQVFLKTFIFFSVVFIVPRVLFWLFSPSTSETFKAPDVTSILSSRIFWSFITTVIIILIHVTFVRSIYRKEYGALDYGVLLRREVKVAQPLHTLFDRLVSSLSNARWELVAQDKNKGVLQFRVWDLVRSWDEIVTIQLYPENEDHTNLKIESRPNSWLQIIDIGNNLRNVQRVQQVLRQ